ncbi:sec-independent protein translocase protein TatB [Kibdelosporangium banguiense]|uniref:Sec-independent protein translocase protein TatB n=2 Tax=Kibdelosporangium banguiense TaxID=1365924 RepID=A0ABS4TXF3_9PSEU|nr:sec-independent protein translocase protein TatB [Kibdelosporangium banguiense]
MFVLLLAALFILGPERLPAAAKWLGLTMRRLREFATTTREQLEAELGPEADELREPLQDLAAFRAAEPQRMVTRYLVEILDSTPVPENRPTGRNSTPVNAGRRGGPLRPGESPPVDPDAT